jgi:serine/threonine-protein kinase HipA
MGGSPARVREILERIGAAISDTSKELRTYLKDHPDFEDIGNHMLQEWELGVELSLKVA